MKLHQWSGMIHRAVGAACLLAPAVAAFSATPTIQWNTSVYQPFPTTSSGWYQAVQAIGQDADGDLVSVRVDYLNPSTNSWTAFSWKGGGNGYTSTSDNNFILAVGAAPNYGAQCFRAQASDGASNNTPFIYLLVKPNGTTFTIDDLPIDPANGRRFMPNAGNRTMNSRVFGGVLNNLNGKSGYTVWFKDGIHDFDTSWGRFNFTSSDQVWTNIMNHPNDDEAARVSKSGGTYTYNPGSLGTISGASDITFKAENDGGAILKWASYSAQGTLVPASSSEMFTEYSGLNPANYMGGNPRPWPLPRPFIVVASNTHDIVFDGLEFVGNYALKTVGTRADQGSHLWLSGLYTQVQNCGFAYSPGWSITLSGAEDTHLDANAIHNGSGDGINVSGSDGSWIVGNVINNVGDDAIVLSGDNNHAIWNQIEDAGWRGFLVHGSTNSEIANNNVISTAGYGVEVSPFEGSQMAATSGLSIADNTFSGVGSHTRHHSGTYEGSRTIILLGLTSGVSIDGNTLNRHGGGGGSNPNDWGVRVLANTDDQNASTIRSNNTFNGFSTGVNDVYVTP